MQIIAFINDADSVRNIPNHIGESTLLQKIAPEREPPLWKPLAGSVQAENDSEVGQPSPNQNSSSISMSPSDE